MLRAGLPVGLSLLVACGGPPSPRIPVAAARVGRVALAREPAIDQAFPVGDGSPSAAGLPPVRCAPAADHPGAHRCRVPFGLDDAEASHGRHEAAALTVRLGDATLRRGQPGETTGVWWLEGSRDLLVRADGAVDAVDVRGAPVDAWLAANRPPSPAGWRAWVDGAGDDPTRSQRAVPAAAGLGVGWRVTGDADAARAFVATIRRLAPGIDGAMDEPAVTVTARSGAQTWTVTAAAPMGDGEASLRLEVPAVTGEVELSVTVAGAPGLADAILLVEPAWVPAADRPRTVVVALVDTVRADHLGIYGYERPTTPHLDALARHGLVFDQVRSVAPWTLPSIRSIVSGRPPERWEASGHIGRWFAEAGFVTRMWTANAFATPRFGWGQAWSSFTYLPDAPATGLVDAALAAIQADAGRDRLYVLHLMDAHLPYREPAAWRERFVRGPEPKALLGRTNRKEIAALSEDDPGFAAARDYLVGRYDQNIAYLDDEIARLRAGLPDDTTLMIVADHGEEFWEHGGFEHGHALFEELIRVPLIVLGPGVPVGRVATPLSHQVAPDLLCALAGVPCPVDNLRSSASGLDLSTPQDQLIGRLLRGDRTTWGVVSGARKAVRRRQGGADVYDLTADPGEQSVAERMDEASFWVSVPAGVEVAAALRVDGPGAARVLPPSVARLAIVAPAPVRSAWREGLDASLQQAVPRVDGARIELVANGGLLPREFWFVTDDLAAVTEVEVEVTLTDGAVHRATVPVVPPERAPAARPTARDADDWVVVREPAVREQEGASTGGASSATLRQQLETLGYVN